MTSNTHARPAKSKSDELLAYGLAVGVLLVPSLTARLTEVFTIEETAGVDPTRSKFLIIGL